MRKKHLNKVRVSVTTQAAARALLVYARSVDGVAPEQIALLERLSHCDKFPRRRLWMPASDSEDRSFLQSFDQVDWTKTGYAADLDPTLGTPIEELKLTVRPYNCLKNNGIHSLGDLVARTAQDLKDLRNFGEKSLVEVVAKLEELFGLKLKQPETAAAAA